MLFLKLRHKLHAVSLLLLKQMRTRLPSHSRARHTIRRLSELTNQPFAVFVAHSDYRQDHGGAEKYQLEDVQQVNARGINVFQIYPRKIRKRFLFINHGVHAFGINFNDISLSRRVPPWLLGEVLKVFNQSHSLISYNIHHLFQWRPRSISRLLRELRGQRVFVYLHDVFFCCPCVRFQRKNKASCGALGGIYDPRSCSACKYGAEVPHTRQLYLEVFRLAQRIISPSRVMTQAFQDSYPSIFLDKVIFVEHQKLDYSHAKPHHKNEKIRIAYFGLKYHHKGWETFEKLFRNNSLACLYDFYHVGCGESTGNGLVKQVDYSYRIGGFNAGVDVLLRNLIDVVVLLSIVPEAYSYTMHEAYAAGIPILACRNSGNIAYKIENGSVYGRLFENEENLLSFLDDEVSVFRFLNQNRNRFISTPQMQSVFLQLTQEASIRPA